jgi:hypothetical protein
MRQDERNVDTDPTNAGGEAGKVVEPTRDSGLPSFTQRDLPNPLLLRKILGPVITVGISMAAGECILWPFLHPAGDQPSW